MPTLQTIETRPVASGNDEPRLARSEQQLKCRLWSSLVELCELLQIAAHAMPLEPQLFQHLQYRPGQQVCIDGAAFDALYVVNAGFLKTVSVDEWGGEQVLGFPMKGDILGMDGICNRRYASKAVALSCCEVIRVPFKTLTTLMKAHPCFEEAMFEILGQELTRKQSAIGALTCLGAAARVARFLLLLAERFAKIGYSSKRYVLQMTREEIASYLGIKHETVSRAISAFHDVGLITVDRRLVTIHDVDALRMLRRLSPSHKLT
jgi:CRP/FNR family transcriptional regulator, anaerobic regulatory protein